MSSKNTNEKIWNNLEVIDNEKKVDEKLQNLEDNQALWLLKLLDVQIPNIDIDLAVDREDKKYYFLSNYWKGNQQVLDIPLEFNKLTKLWDLLVKLFNNDIQLFWSLHWRSIWKDTWMPDGLEEKFIESWDFTKNDIEEIFVFVMNSKWISMNDWNIEETICKNSKVTGECKEALWY